jgi:hypothetical protein
MFFKKGVFSMKFLNVFLGWSISCLLGDETFWVSLSSASGTVNGMAKNFDYDSDEKTVTIKDNYCESYSCGTCARQSWQCSSCC